MLIVPCPHCGWWGFAHADELGPRDAVRELLKHLASSHPLVLPAPAVQAAPNAPRR